jgi:hypothetical protein
MHADEQRQRAKERALQTRTAAPARSSVPLPLRQRAAEARDRDRHIRVNRVNIRLQARTCSHGTSSVNTRRTGPAPASPRRMRRSVAGLVPEHECHRRAVALLRIGNACSAPIQPPSCSGTEGTTLAFAHREASLRSRRHYRSGRENYFGAQRRGRSHWVAKRERCQRSRGVSKLVQCGRGPVKA